MLHIIGFIFKCIGILLAVLLGVFLLLLAVLLFVPLRYEGKAEFPGQEEKITARGKATWLLHLLWAEVAWQNGEVRWKVRFAWKFFGSERTENEAAKDVEEIMEETAEASLPKNMTAEKQSVREEKKAEPKQQDLERKTESSSSKKKTADEKKARSVKEQSAKKKDTFWGKIKKKFRKVLEWIKCTFRKICDKIKEGRKFKERVMEFLQNEAHKEAVLRAKKEFIWLKRFLKVKKGHITLRFGFEDPSLTGKMLGVLGILYPIVNGNLYVTPEFEEECLEGEVYLKGQMRGIHLLILLIRMAADQNVRQTYKDIMEWKDS